MVVYLKWLSSFTMGVPQIDAEHQGLMTAIQEVAAALDDGDTGLARAKLDAMLEQSKAHFRSEEALLRQHQYPHLDDHIQFHKDLLDHASKMRAACLTAMETGDTQECLEHLVQFLIDDIIVGDKKFEDFLKKRT